MTEVEQQPQTNGIQTAEEDENKVRPAEIEAVSRGDKTWNLSLTVQMSQDFFFLNNDFEKNSALGAKTCFFCIDNDKLSHEYEFE